MRRLRVLYVTDRWDGPYRYRVQQACEQLRAGGDVANVAHVATPGLAASISRYGAVVLFRLPWTEHAEAVVAAARRAGVPLFFDIDDLAFDPSFEELMPFRKRYSSEEWARSYGRPMVALRRTFEACDAFIGSTPELCEQAARLGKRSYAHPNVVPPSYLRRGRVAPGLHRALSSQPTIGYFSGSDTHDEDVASIAPALTRVLAAHPDARLLVVGHLDLGGHRPEISQRVVRLPYMHYRDFSLAYAACDVTLAPLATVNAFTNSKSALKFFEAGAFFTPVVATPVREMKTAIEHGRTGWLAETEQDWVDAVTSALDRAVSAKVGRAAREEVERRYSAASQRGHLHHIFEGHAVAGRGRAPRPTRLEVEDETGSARRVDRLLRPGRATRDLLRILRAAQRDVRPGPKTADAEPVLDSLDGSARARAALEEQGAFVLTEGDVSTWWAGPHVAPRGSVPGESRSKGTDPSLTTPSLDIDPTKYRYLLLRLRAEAPTPSARAQVFWKSSAPATFDERASVTFSIAPDGLDQTVVVDLWDTIGRHAWQRQHRVTHLRLDPLDRPGAFRIGAAVLVPEQLPWAAPAGPGSAGDRQPPAATAAGSRARLARVIEALTPGGHARVVLHGEPGDVREALAEVGRGRDVVVERLTRTADHTVTVDLVGAAHHESRGVDIVVPVYNAKELVLRCVGSALRHARGDYRLVIVDDASTDPGLVEALADLSRAHANVVLIRNPHNLGFVGTANRGMRHAEGRDVLLLNSDTEVFSGFLEGLAKVAYSDSRAGMVSPVSNNATICSVPDFCRKNELPEGTTREDMAELVLRSSLHLAPELVTPHGFCLYLRADFLAAVGLFDEAQFGRGFGEENDLGERAKSAGWKTLLADDVYVWHAGKGSFGEEGLALEQRHGKVLAERHPGYHPAVARFVQTNPLAPVQEVVRRHLDRRSHRLAPAPLFILHASPFSPSRGGVEYCVRDLVQALRIPRAVLAYPADGALEVAEVLHGALHQPVIYRFHLGHPPSRFCHEHAEALEAMSEVLDLFRIGWVHVHHLMFLPLAVGRLLRERALPYLVTVHDFYPACPSFNLLDVRTNTPCCPASRRGDRARVEACQRALFAHLAEPLPADPVAFVARHREEFEALLSGAHRVLFPSASTERIVRELLRIEGAHTAVVPHGYDAPPVPERRLVRSRALRVAIVGQVAYAAKGADAYLRTMSVAKELGVDVEWHVFGQTDLFDFDRRLDALGSSVRIVRHGAYDRDTIVPRLAEAGVDLGLLLPAWPETFSYTLSELVAARLPVIARRIGAVEDRLTGAPFATLVDGPAQAARELARLSRDRPSLEAMTRAVPELTGTAESAETQRALHEECACASRVQGERFALAAEHERLNHLYVPTNAVEPKAALVTQPAREIAAAWWYPYAERLKPYAPEGVRHAVRRRLARDGSHVVRRFKLPGPSVTLGQELTLDRRYLATTQLTSHGVDPFLLIEMPPLDPALVKLVRFNLWCSTPNAVFAQLYFRHEGADGFDEAHSITIPLEGARGVWQEYVARLDGAERAPAWYEGGPIVALRFDPINVVGPIGLGELSLCGLSDAP